MGEFGRGRNWLAVPHQQIYDDIRTGPGERGIEDARRRCEAVGAAFARAERDIADGLRRIGIAYEGARAQAALGAVGGLAAWTADAQLGAVIAVDLVSEQGEAFVRTRDSMPVPAGDQEQVAGGIAGVFENTVDREPVEEAAREAHERAAGLMREYEATSGTVVNGMPVFVPPPDVVVDVPGAGRAAWPRGGAAAGDGAGGAPDRLISGDTGRPIADHRLGTPCPVGASGRSCQR
ncbi:hypothetical protein [Streptoalloteichus hindustanus]|uniref:Uncharacterized protein n=1 Tax=Streptoalloteichus hindustanus TaxID=2017 RepID=A0A1M4UE76_STRHI|nr:hypothetical protein [Streptoalloteichus hindustanus]SHE54907.1 hypothetical protein SAMN05444320_101387 [Streptoalloteichus hindustanus]